MLLRLNKLRNVELDGKIILNSEQVQIYKDPDMI
jgi:hypothetical protein